MGRNTLICHILNSDLTEAGTTRARKFNQEFVWRKRQWAIPSEDNPVVVKVNNQDGKETEGYIPIPSFITDKKGVKHLYVHVNESDGVYYFLSPKTLNLYDTKGNPIDKCGECGGAISIDARNVRDMLKRKTIDTFWGLDNTFTLLLIVMGIIGIGAMGFAFYLFGQNNALQTQVKILQSQIPTVANMLIGVL